MLKDETDVTLRGSYTLVKQCIGLLNMLKKIVIKFVKTGSIAIFFCLEIKKERNI